MLGVSEAYAAGDARNSAALAGQDLSSIIHEVAWHKTAANACERGGSKSAA